MATTADTPVTRIIAITGDLTFGSVEISRTVNRTLTITNTGTAALTVASVSCPAGFSVDWSAGSIAAGGVQVVTVTFAPSAAQTYAGALSVQSDATSGVNSAAVTGTGASASPGTPPPPPAVTPTRIVTLSGHLAFGEVLVGAAVSALLTVGNAGTAPLTVSGVTVPEGYSVTWPSGAIAVGTSIAVTVTFAPASARSYDGTLVVTSNATSGTGSIAMTGRGAITPPPTRILALIGNLSFGSVGVGTVATSLLTIANHGNAALTVSSITVPAGFTTNWSSGVVPAGSAQSVVVTFAPTSAQAATGLLTVNSNATSGASTAAVSGAGFFPSTTEIVAYLSSLHAQGRTRLAADQKAAERAAAAEGTILSGGFIAQSGRLYTDAVQRFLDGALAFIRQRAQTSAIDTAAIASLLNGYANDDVAYLDTFFYGNAIWRNSTAALAATVPDFRSDVRERYRLAILQLP